MSGEVEFKASVELDGKPYALGFKLPLDTFVDADGKKCANALWEAMKQIILMSPAERAGHVNCDGYVQ